MRSTSAGPPGQPDHTAIATLLPALSILTVTLLARLMHCGVPVARVGRSYTGPLGSPAITPRVNCAKSALASKSGLEALIAGTIEVTPMSQMPKAVRDSIRDVLAGRSTRLNFNQWSIGQPLKEIPEEVFALSELEELNFSDNSIRIVPERIRALSKLKKTQSCPQPR